MVEDTPFELSLNFEFSGKSLLKCNSVISYISIYESFISRRLSNLSSTGISSSSIVNRSVLKREIRYSFFLFLLAYLRSFKNEITFKDLFSKMEVAMGKDSVISFNWMSPFISN